MRRLAIALMLGIPVLAVALPAFALAQEAKKKEPAAPTMAKKDTPAKPALPKENLLLEIHEDGKITYYVERDDAVRTIVAKLKALASELRETEAELTDEIHRLRGKLLTLQSKCNKEG